MDTVVELKDVHGEWWNLTEGDRGVWLGTDPKGLYDPPVKTVYEDPGNYPGSRFLNARILRRDITFGVEILHDAEVGENSWISRDSEWRKAWSFDKDCELHITTPESGTRRLKIRLGESIEVGMFTDPRGNTLNGALMTCVAGDPFWWEDDVVYSAVTTTDTTFDPNPLPWPWPQEDLPTETLTIDVDPSDGHGGLNPTDQPVSLKWTVPGSTEAPALPYVPAIPWLGAPNSPATIWTIPDYSFEDDDLANRRLRMPGLIGGLRTNEIQRIYIEGRPTAGTFTLTLGSETTSALPYNPTTAQIKAALEALAAIAFNDVKVTRDKRVNEVQYVDVTGGATSGTYTLTFDGATTAPINYNASIAELRAKLIALSTMNLWDVRITEEIVREEVVVSVVGEPTSGTFTLSLDGQTTAPIPWNASALTMQTRLAALPNIGILQVPVTREWIRYAPWKLRFAGNRVAGVDVSDLVADPANLAGGAGLDVRVETVKRGLHRYRIEFRDDLAAFNMPQMTANSAGLVGGVDPEVVITTEVDGSHPYIVEFQNNVAGIDFPLMVGNQSFTSHIGTLSPFVRVTETQKGHTYPAENAVIDTDPRVEQVSAESVSPLWARMNGVRFRHPVPPYTPAKSFEVTVSGCVPGQMITMRIPRPWTRPWGLE
jgi:hypothetical protein